MIVDLLLKSNAGGLCAVLLAWCSEVETALSSAPEIKGSHYKRSVITSIKTIGIPLVISVARHRDENGRRVGKIVSPLVKYSSFTLPYIYLVLLCDESRKDLNLTVVDLCKSTGISVPTLYRWKARYGEAFAKWKDQCLTDMKKVKSSMAPPLPPVLFHEQFMRIVSSQTQHYYTNISTTAVMQDQGTG